MYIAVPESLNFLRSRADNAAAAAHSCTEYNPMNDDDDDHSRGGEEEESRCCSLHLEEFLAALEMRLDSGESSLSFDRIVKCIDIYR